MKSKILPHAARIAKCILIAATLLAMLPLAARADKPGEADYTPYVKLEAVNGVTTPDGDQAYKATYYATDGDVPTEEGIYTLGYNGCRLPYIEGIGSWQITAVEINESFANYPGTNYSYMFSVFENLAQITGIEHINVSNATDLSYMFFSCEQLRELDLSSFNTGQVINAEMMFASCYNLEVIYVSDKWDMTGISDRDVFDNNRLLFGGEGTYAGFNESYGKDYALIDGTNDKHGLLTKTGAPKYELNQNDVTLINISNDGEPEFNQYQDLDMDLIALKIKGIETPLSPSLLTVTGYDKYTSGEQTLKVTFRGKEYEFPITVKKGTIYYFSLADGSRYVDKGTKPEDIIFEVIPSGGEPFQIPLTNTKVTYTGEINFDKLGDYPITVTYEGKTYDLTITVRNKIKELNFDNVKCYPLNKKLRQLPSGTVEVICDDESKNYTIDFSELEVILDDYDQGLLSVTYQDSSQQLSIDFDPRPLVPRAIYISEVKELRFTICPEGFAAPGGMFFDLPDPWE